MKKLNWYQHLLFWVGLLGVFIGPWLFTRSYLREWDFFDFSNTGQIGDTIGGVTAPVVGLVSILLLWWTLRAQLDFNVNQDKINKEQKKFNDASRVLAMQAQIMQLDELIHYGYSTSDRTHEGRGVSSLRNLRKGTAADVKIPYEVLMILIEKVHILDVSVKSLVDVTVKSDLSDEEKKSTMAIAFSYIDSIVNFYNMVHHNNLKYLLPHNEAGFELLSEPVAGEKLRNISEKYEEGLRNSRDLCIKTLG